MPKTRGRTICVCCQLRPGLQQRCLVPLSLSPHGAATQCSRQVPLAGPWSPPFDCLVQAEPMQRGPPWPPFSCWLEVPWRVWASCVSFTIDSTAGSVMVQGAVQDEHIKWGRAMSGKRARSHEDCPCNEITRVSRQASMRGPGRRSSCDAARMWWLPAGPMSTAHGGSSAYASN